jgi:hypothetical protein
MAGMLMQRAWEIGEVFGIWYLGEAQVGPAQLVHVHLEDVAEVDEHVAGALGPAHDVDAGRDDVGALPPPRQALPEGQLEEVEGHVDMVRAQAQLLGQRLDSLPGILQSYLPRLAASARVEGSSEVAAPSSWQRRVRSIHRVRTLHRVRAIHRVWTIHCMAYTG